MFTRGFRLDLSFKAANNVFQTAIEKGFNVDGLSRYVHTNMFYHVDFYQHIRENLDFLDAPGMGFLGSSHFSARFPCLSADPHRSPSFSDHLKHKKTSRLMGTMIIYTYPINFL